jgi:hypothetical protein
VSERNVVDASRRRLKARGAWVVPQTGVAIAGIPDDIGAYRSIAIALEYKQPGRKPRPLQTFHLNQATRAGAYARTITHPSQVDELLDAIDTHLNTGTP